MGWGFASPDSDYNVRFIYVHQRSWWLWETTYGWLDLQRYRFPAPVGVRFWAAVMARPRPISSSLPRRANGRFSCRFRECVGTSVAVGGRASGTSASNVKPDSFSGPLHAISQWLETFVSDKGAMFVSQEGMRTDGQPLKLDWYLSAAQNHGPYSPWRLNCAGAKTGTRRMVATRRDAMY
jgi:hypothetical protein